MHPQSTKDEIDSVYSSGRIKNHRKVLQCISAIFGHSNHKYRQNEDTPQCVADSRDALRAK